MEWSKWHLCLEQNHWAPGRSSSVALQHYAKDTIFSFAIVWGWRKLIRLLTIYCKTTCDLIARFQSRLKFADWTPIKCFLFGRHVLFCWRWQMSRLRQIFFIHEFSGQLLRHVFRWWQKKGACTAGAIKSSSIYCKLGGTQPKHLSSSVLLTRNATMYFFVNL